MKIFASGISTETNTFCPILTSLEDFLVQRGTDISEGRIAFPSLDLSRVWGKLALEQNIEFTFGLMAWAEPSGITTESAYVTLRDEMLSHLESAMPVDIVLLNLHGAMVSQGCDDCEEDMIQRVRQIVGTNVVIGVELDLHCHLSRSKISAADLVVTYKEYPHIDVLERARELFELAVKTSLGDIHPKMELFDCRMVGMYPTSQEPLRGFVDDMTTAEQRTGVLSLSFGHGFPFADNPNVGAKVIAITDGDQSLALSVAREFGVRIYKLRNEIGFDTVSLPMDEAFAKALASKASPVVVADQSDNTGGGAPGDSTFALRWLLDHKVEDVGIAILYDPEVVRIARKAGSGARLAVRLGGKLGPASGDPVDMVVTVLSTVENYVHSITQQSGELLLFPVGDVVALRCCGIDIVVGSKRCQCYSPAIFADLGIDPGLKRILIPKSTQHFYGGFVGIAASIIYMAAPGAVSPDPKQIPYSRLDISRLYPWAPNPLAV